MYRINIVNNIVKNIFSIAETQISNGYRFILIIEHFFYVDDLVLTFLYINQQMMF